MHGHHEPVALLGEVGAGVQPRQLCGAFDLDVSTTGERDGDGLGSGVTSERVGLGEVEELLEGEVAQLGVLRVRRCARA